MRIYPLILAVTAALPLTLAACDRYVSETKHTQTDSNGNVKQETKTVREDNNGNVTVEKQKTEQHAIDR